jgi:transcriptional regulator with XRE-family HTH domain
MKHRNLIGDRIRRLRKLRGWTQEKFARKLRAAGCPITRDIVARWETRETTVSDIRLPGVARVLRVSIADLFPPMRRSNPRKF